MSSSRNPRDGRECAPFSHSRGKRNVVCQCYPRLRCNFPIGCRCLARRNVHMTHFTVHSATHFPVCRRLGGQGCQGPRRSRHRLSQVSSNSSDTTWSGEFDCSESWHITDPVCAADHRKGLRDLPSQVSSLPAQSPSEIFATKNLQFPPGSA